MSEIKKGDLVYIAKWPCCGAGLGEMFIVDGFMQHRRGTCTVCGAHSIPNAPFCFSAGADSQRNGAPVAWVRKVDPLDESQTATPEEIREDA